MCENHPTIKISSPADEDITDLLHQKLIASGQTLSASELKEFVLYVADKTGHLICGCKGEIAFRSMHISELWVEEAERGGGLGTALLRCAEEHAVQNRCTRIHIETRSEQARRLYERFGFRVFGELEEYEGNQSYYYLNKSLA